MLKNFVVGSALVGVTFTVHAVGSSRWIDLLLRRYTDRDGSWKSGDTVWVLISTGVALLALHVVEALVWALAYYLLPTEGQLQTFEEALYFSMVTFTTLGYGDITLDSTWRLLSGIEAINGILLAGWSTALLFSVVQRGWRLSHQKEENQQKGSAS